MKKMVRSMEASSILASLVVIALMALAAPAQKIEKFDIVSYVAPVGWEKEVEEGMITFERTNTAGDKFSVITVSKSIPSIGTSADNFKLAWESGAAEFGDKALRPQMAETGTLNGWVREVGSAMVTVEGERVNLSVLTFSSPAKLVFLIILTNDETHKADIVKFLDSLQLPKPDAK